MNGIKGSGKLFQTLKKNKKDKVIDGITASSQVTCQLVMFLLVIGLQMFSYSLLFMLHRSVQCGFEIYIFNIKKCVSFVVMRLCFIM